MTWQYMTRHLYLQSLISISGAAILEYECPVTTKHKETMTEHLVFEV